MYQYPNSTYKIIGFQSPLCDFDYDRAVDWAYDMLTYGYETPNLLMLAAITKPTNQWECERYFKASLQELNLPILTEEHAAIASVWINIHEISLGIAVWKNLTEIHTAFVGSDPEDIFFDFNLLYWANGELDYNGNQYYWDGMTAENAQQIIINYTNAWLEKYKPLIDNLLPLP